MIFRLSHRLASKLRRMEQLCRVSELEDEFGSPFGSPFGAAGASHNAPQVRQEAVVPAAAFDTSQNTLHTSKVKWRTAPEVPKTDEAKASLAKVKWRTVTQVSDEALERRNITTAAEAAKMKALTVGVSMRQIRLSPTNQTARPMNWVSKRLGDTDQEDSDAAAGASAGASARRGNPEAPAVLHNKAIRDISEHTGSRIDASQLVVDVEHLLQLEESAMQQAKGRGQEDENVFGGDECCSSMSSRET